MVMPDDNVDMEVEASITPIAIEEGPVFAIREGGKDRWSLVLLPVL